MSHPCQFSVRLWIKGESSSFMLAKFADLVDAINFAYEKSKGQHSHAAKTVTVYDLGGHVFQKYCEGRLLG